MNIKLNKVIPFLVLLLSIRYQVHCQDFYSHYNNLANYRASEITYDSLSQLTFSDRSSWLLLSYINLYESTKDKGYLIKFINHSILCQRYRQDQAYSPNSHPPKWTLEIQSGGESTYLNGLLLYPMAKFIFLVMSDPHLRNSPLPIGQNQTNNLILTPVLNGMPDYGIPNTQSYFHFAWWLGYRVEQSLAYLNAYRWKNNLGFLKDYNSTRASHLNWNSVYASALLYMGLNFLYNPLYSNFGFDPDRHLYIQKADIIGQYYHGLQQIQGGPSRPVLIDWFNASYSWMHAGWRNKTINDPDLQEDLAHGAMDLFFPIESFENGTPFFTHYDMGKFKRALTKNIYYTDPLGIHFRNTVSGSNCGYDGNHPCPSTPTPSDIFWAEVLNWMPLYKFDDNSQPKVYDILTAHAGNLLNHPVKKFLSGYQGLLGLSYVVKAQWDKECVDLSMRNRKLVYDQDFTIKGRLVIDPSVPNTLLNSTASFADPIINTPDFTIEPGVTCNMKAGGGIILKPGFKAKQGSQFKARHVPSNCSSENELRIYPDVPGNPVLENSPTKDLFSISVNPNPGSGIFLVSTNQTSAENKTISFELFNSGGLRVFLFTAQEGQTMEINLSEFSTGLYFLSGVSSSGERASCKILIQK